MLESEFQSRFKKWFYENKPNTSCALEYKKTDGDTFNLSLWEKKEPHQIRNLLDSCGQNGCYHKISDQSMGTKPFDAFFLCNAEAYLIVYFNKHKMFCMYTAKEVYDLLRDGKNVSFKSIPQDKLFSL